MTIWPEALAAAIQLERDGEEFYLKATAEASNVIAGRMFESLADDELRHLEWIENLSPGVKDARAADEGLYGRLKGIFADAPPDVRDGAALAANDIEAIDLAIGMEVDAHTGVDR
jgi:rubrerythrin